MHELKSGDTCQKYSGKKINHKIVQEPLSFFLARFSWTLISKKAAKIFFYLFGDEGPGSFGSLDGQAAIFKLFSVYCR